MPRGHIILNCHNWQHVSGSCFIWISEEWLLATDKVRQELDLLRIPNHNTLQRRYQKVRKLDFEKIKNQILEEESIADNTVFLPR